MDPVRWTGLRWNNATVLLPLPMIPVSGLLEASWPGLSPIVQHRSPDGTPRPGAGSPEPGEPESIVEPEVAPQFPAGFYGVIMGSTCSLGQDLITMRAMRNIIVRQLECVLP